VDSLVAAVNPVVPKSHRVNGDTGTYPSESIWGDRELLFLPFLESVGEAPGMSIELSCQSFIDERDNFYRPKEKNEDSEATKEESETDPQGTGDPKPRPSCYRTDISQLEIQEN
jgi:hypothetical protein